MLKSVAGMLYHLEHYHTRKQGKKRQDKNRKEEDIEETSLSKEALRQKRRRDKIWTDSLEDWRKKPKMAKKDGGMADKEGSEELEMEEEEEEERGDGDFLVEGSDVESNLSEATAGGKLQVDLKDIKKEFKKNHRVECPVEVCMC